MSNAKKTYFLAPNFHLLPPPTGPLLLGSLISSPSKPEHILNRSPSRLPIPSNTPTYTHHQENFTSAKSKTLSGSLGGFTALSAFLASILSLRVDADVDCAFSKSTIYKCQDLETIYFYPDDDYIRKSIEIERVKGYMKMSHWEKPVYMVTGLKIARGMKAESNTGRKIEAKLEVGLDGTVFTGVPISGGPKVGGVVEGKDGVAWSKADDFVFAYKVVRIKLKRKYGEFKLGDYNRGALYNDDVEEGAEGNLRDKWDISQLEDMDEDEGMIPHVLCEEEVSNEALLRNKSFAIY